MDKEEWLRAIKCNKEELIEWLNEMYEDEKFYQDIIRKYEKSYNVGIESSKREIYNAKTLQNELEFHTQVKANGFSYTRSWN